MKKEIGNPRDDLFPFFVFSGGKDLPKYDLAVVGAGLGGLAAAALAARMNKRTIVLEPEDAIGGSLRSYEKDSFSFCPGPSLSFGFERGGTLQQLNERLRIAQNASLRSPCYQVALPDRRITVYAEPSETLDELRREFPKEIDSIAAFYSDIRKKSLQNSKRTISAFLSRRRSASGFVGSYRFSREFTAFLDVQSLYFFRRPASGLKLNSLLTLFDTAPFTVEGGFLRLANHLLDVLLRHGGDIRYNVPLDRISIKQGSIFTPDEPIETGAVLINTEQSDPQPTLVAGIREQGVPASMLTDVLCLPDYVHADSFFSLSMSAPDDGRAPSGMRSITAQFSPKTSRDINEQKRLVEALIPFLSEFSIFFAGYEQSPRKIGLEATGAMHRVRGSELLFRSPLGIYRFPDGAGTPLQTIAAAFEFTKRWT